MPIAWSIACGRDEGRKRVEREGGVENRQSEFATSVAACAHCHGHFRGGRAPDTCGPQRAVWLGEDGGMTSGGRRPKFQIQSGLPPQFEGFQQGFRIWGFGP